MSLVDHARVVIAGVPRAGKSTMAALAGEVPTTHTDDLAALGWSQASAAAAELLDAPGPWVLEGVAMARALRKWLAAHPGGMPCDVVAHLVEPSLELTAGQVTMAKGCMTVWAEVEPLLRARGVTMASPEVAADLLVAMGIVARERAGRGA